MLLELKIVAKTVRLCLEYIYKPASENLIVKAIYSDRKFVGRVVITVEGWSIMPNFVYLRGILKMCERIGKYLPNELNIHEYVQLTRFIEKDNLDRLSCDWCSLVNGFNEYTLDVIKNRDADDILKIDTIYHDICRFGIKLPMYLSSSSTITNEYKCSEESAMNFIVQNGIVYNADNRLKLVKFVQKLLELRNIAAMLESRWCPFRYMQNMAYERYYQGTDLEEITETLRNYGQVVCNQCVRDLNRLHPATAPVKSVFEPYVAQMENYLSVDRRKR